MKMPNKVVELKGYRDGLHLIINPKYPLHQVESAIIDRLSNIADLLSGIEINLDVGDRALKNEELLRIQRLLNDRYKMEIKQVNNDSQQTPKSKEKSEIGVAPAIHEQQEELLIYESESYYDKSERTQVIQGTLRSGQRVCFLEGDIVVIGDVNPGGEVVASGDVIVFGSLKGMAHAGASGDESAVIIALSLQPIQLRIGKVINRPPSEDVEIDKSIPEIAKIEDDIIKISPYRKL